MLSHAFVLLLRVVKESIEFTTFFQNSNRPSCKMVSSLTRDDFRIKPRKHSSRMCTACSPIVRASATRCGRGSSSEQV